MHGIYLIADSSFPASQSFELLNKLLIPEITLLQYRDKHAAPEQRKQHIIKLKALCTQKNIPLIINDKVQLALETKADGVHLGQNDMSLSDARALLGTNKIIGISCGQSLEQAQAGQEAGADYVSFGAVFPSLTKPEARPISLHDLSAYKKQLHIPVCAIGGINNTNIREIFATRVDMVAMIGHIWRAADPYQALTACVSAINSDISQA